MNSIVIIADIIESKKISDRNGVQLSLKKVLDERNLESKDSILSPFTITLGDEFQAVYRVSETLINDLLKIMVRLFPVRIRFSIGHGQISTEINPLEAIGMDGPAFYTARNGMDKLKKINYSLMQICGTPSVHTDYINSSLLLSMSLMADWKKNTLLIFHELLAGESIRNIADKLGISERGVYKTLNTHRLKIFADYFISLQKEITAILIP